jgi:archaemetzincin
MGTIHVVPLPALGDVELERLASIVGDLLHRDAVIAPALRDVDFAFDPSRNQYASRALLAALLERRRDGAERVLGVTGLDLFVPVLTFVFGEAQLDGPAAVVSTCRLVPEFYGLRRDPALVQERLEKEAVHELGHTYGLVHCPDGLCVMRSSTYVEELDQKRLDFCTDCTRALLGPPAHHRGNRVP